MQPMVALPRALPFFLVDDPFFPLAAGAVLTGVGAGAGAATLSDAIEPFLVGDAGGVVVLLSLAARLLGEAVSSIDRAEAAGEAFAGGDDTFGASTSMWSSSLLFLDILSGVTLFAATCPTEPSC
jgi:hypothetical protein